MRVDFNEDRALAVFKILDEQWRKKIGVFEGIILPQNRWPLPMKTNQEKANFLFYSAIFMRGAIISEDPFKFLVSFWESCPNLYNPKFVISQKLEPNDIANILMNIMPKSRNGSNELKNAFNLYKVEQFMNSWINNSRLVVEKFDGDVLNIFKGVDDFEEAFARIDYKRYKGNGLTGMRRKIFSLLTIWLQEKKLIPHFPTPIPVDFHALRILWETEIISLPELKPLKLNDRHPKIYEGKVALRINGEEFINIITKWSQNFLSKIKISHLSINPALWVLSRELCVKNYQTTSKGRGTILIEPNELQQNPKLWPKEYYDPCSVCPIETFCTGAIPAAPYYIWGILMRLRRVSYPHLPPPIQSVLPGIGEEKSIFHKRTSKRTKK